jgi:outer membrane usher protein
MEAGEDLITGGPLLTTRLPIGELELAGAASRSGDAVGLAGSVAYLYRGSTVSGGAALQTMSDRYGTLQLRPQDDRARFDVNAFVGFPLFGIGTATLQHGYKVPRDANPRAQTSVFSSFRLSKSASLLLSATRTDERGTPPAWEGFAGITYLFGERTTASVGYQRRADDGVTTVELQRSLPVGTGVGYRLQAQSGDDAQSRTGAALLQAQGPFGRYEAGYNHSADTGVITTRITGGLVGIGGAVYPTRAVEGSFGLIKVPDVEGVRGYLNGHEVGTTDRRGNLAVPSLLPYYGNRVAIADEDVPLEYRIEARERLIAPPFRGGAVIRFPVERVQAITGRVLLDVEGATVVPRYGEMRLVVAGRELESPIGNDGEFYFEDVGPGRHTATVIHEDLRCTLVLDVSPAKAPVVDLETVRCRPETGGRRTP